MNRAAPSLLLSLKPCYADLVFKGLKRAELRRRIGPHMRDRDVFIYVSSPVMELRGGFRVGQLWSGSPQEVWSMVCGLAPLDKQDFDAYFEGREVAYALEIKDVWEYKNPVALSDLRNRFQKFVVPQSWRYVRPEEYRSFRRMKHRGRETTGGLCPDYCARASAGATASNSGALTSENIKPPLDNQNSRFRPPRTRNVHALPD